MIKMKRQKAKWSAVLTSAAMLMINIPVSAEEQSQYINGVTQINGYTEFEQPQVIENQDMAQLGYSDIRAYEIENAGELAWFVQHFYAGDLETQNVSLADNIDMSASKLSTDIQSSLSSIFILYDPAGFQQTTGTLRYLDGHLPKSDADSDWWNMVYRWTD